MKEEIFTIETYPNVDYLSLPNHFNDEESDKLLPTIQNSDKPLNFNSISKFEYMLKFYNRLVTSSNELEKDFSSTASIIKSSAYADDRTDIIAKGANTYYLRRMRKPDMLLSILKHKFSVIIDPKISGRFSGIYSEFEINIRNRKSPITIPIVITEDEFNSGKFGKKLGRIMTNIKSSDYNPKYAVALYYYLIRDEINLERKCLMIPKSSGWSTIAEDLFFSSADIINPFLYEYIDNDKKSANKNFNRCYSQDTVNRKLMHTERALTDIANDYAEMLPKNWKYKLLAVLRISSLLLYFFKQKNIEPNQIFIIDPITEDNAISIISLLQTSNYTSYSPILLPLTKSDFYKKYNEFVSNDGIALYRDCSLLENRSKLNFSIDLIKNSLHYSEDSKEKKRLINVIVSDNPSNIFLEDTIAMHINFTESDSLHDNNYIKRLQKISGEFDFALIQEIINNQTYMMNKINSAINDSKSTKQNVDYEKIDTIHMLEATMLFLNEYRIISKSDIDKIQNWFTSCNDISTDNKNKITNDFFSSLNHLIHTEQIKLVNQNGMPFFDESQFMAFESKGYLNFGDNVLKKLIIPNMNVTKQSRLILNALSDDNNSFQNVCRCINRRG